jgi:IS30 family transposase
MKNIMSKRIDYGQIAAKLDYPTLDKKLEQLAQREPPKNRKTAVDLLEPLRERIIALHRKGWSSQQLAEELKTAGVPVNPARVRECLNRWTNGGKGAAKRRGTKRDKRWWTEQERSRRRPVETWTDAWLNAVASEW